MIDDVQQISDLEFNGPFPDWWNVVTDFGADPTGVNDSTAAFRAMFFAMSQYRQKDSQYIGYVGYVPAGTYKITETLFLPDKRDVIDNGIGLSVWGENPETTILKWYGPSDNSIIWSDGCHSSVIARLTFDGSGACKAGLQLEHDHDLPTPNTYSRAQDCIFKDSTFGFYQSDELPGIGTDSEFSLMRCKFYRCSTAGVRVVAGEAYNYWVRKCYFEDCTNGVLNGYSGAINVYDSVFVRSTQYDININAGQRVCGIRRNYSYDSNRFCLIYYSNSVVEGNHIFDSVQTDTIQFGYRLKQMFLNNVIKSKSGITTGPVINEIAAFSYNPDIFTPSAPLFIYMNQFNVLNPIQPSSVTPKWNDIQDNIYVQNIVREDIPELPPFPPKVVRPMYYLDGATMQDTIDAATSYATANPDSRPVIYFPCYASGNRTKIPRTLVFPPNVKMSLQGGGIYSAFRVYDENRNNNDPYLLFRGPSHITVQNIKFGYTYAEGHKIGIQAVFDNCDQVGGRFYSDNGTGIPKFEGINNLIVNLTDFPMYSHQQENFPATITGTIDGNGNSRFLLEGGAGANEGEVHYQWATGNGAHVFLRDIWYETTNTAKQYSYSFGLAARPGIFSLESSFIEQHNSPDPMYKLNIFEGDNFGGDMVFVVGLNIGCTKLYDNSSYTNYFSFSGGCPILPDSQQPKTMYRQDGDPLEILPLMKMTTVDNIGFGVFGKRPSDWKKHLYNIIITKPPIWLNPLGYGVNDTKLYRVAGDFLCISGEYVLQDVWTIV